MFYFAPSPACQQVFLSQRSFLGTEIEYAFNSRGTDHPHGIHAKKISHVSRRCKRSEEFAYSKIVIRKIMLNCTIQYTRHSLPAIFPRHVT